jgi:adenylate cyclase
MKRVFCAFFFLLFYVISPAQEVNEDSLLSCLEKAKGPKGKVDLLNLLAQNYRGFSQKERMEKIKSFATLSMQLSKKINYKKGLAEAIYNLGKFHVASSRKYAVATPLLLESLTLFESLKDSSGISKCYLQIGLISYILEYFEDANKNFNLSLNYADNPVTKYLLALSYSELNEYKTSRVYFAKAIKDFQQFGRVHQLNECYMYLGKLFMKMDLTDSAFYYLNLSIFNISSEGDSISLIRPYSFLSSVFLKTGDVDKAIKYAELSRGMESKYNDEISLAEATSTLYQSYAQKGDSKKAFFYLDTLYKIKSKFFMGSTKQKVADMQSLFDFKKKINDQKIRELKDKEIAAEQLQTEKILRNSFLGGTTLLLILLLLLYNRYQIKQKSNLALEDKNKIISNEKDRSEKLLHNILPEEVAEELKLKGSADAKQFDEVTVMFTDFKGFTQISEKLSPSELVAEIHTCFKAFDDIIEKHGIEKIKTIGDSYMCVGGLPVANKTHAVDMVNAALEINSFMQKHLEDRIRNKKEVFEMRIGIHTGTVVAGIVGVRKFAYDIWGDTVNIASRMESSGEAGKVNISGTTYALIKDEFHCVYRGLIEAKSKGQIDMYFVQGPINQA